MIARTPAPGVPLWMVIACPLLLAILLLATSGSFLVVNQPQKSDLIVVLAGETDKRAARGLALLRENYAPKMLLDVPALEKIYDENLIDVARNYVHTLPERPAIAICPIFGLSTKTETRDVLDCLHQQPVHSLLLVTSDYHSRRARMIFRQKLSGYKISVAAASDPQTFGVAWWKHRQWAKKNLDEWLRLVWWELVERWTP
jgi:uncharacterized SAM-binding protein YcdF (DUF218 family)